MTNNIDIMNNIVNKVINNVDENWNKLQKIRYVYLELGKYLEKNTDFFLNEKLAKGNLSLSNEEMNDIYIKDKINISNRNNTNIQYQVICKSAAALLKMCFDKLNIESNLIHTKEQINNINHWFVVAKGDNEEQYFLTLVADLPYIKNSLPTVHFANNISYLDADGKEIYVIPENTNLILSDINYKDKEGNIKVVKEIKHTILTNTKESIERLKRIDDSIGYGKLYDINLLYKRREIHDLFLKFSEENSKIFQIFRSNFNIPEKDSISIDNITKEQVAYFKNELEIYIGNSLFKLNKQRNLRQGNPIKNYILRKLKDIKIDNININLPSRELLKEYKKELKEKYKEEVSVLESLFIIEDRFDNFLKIKQEYNILEEKVNNYNGNNKDEIYNLQKEIFDIDEKLQKCKQDLSIIQLNNILDRMAYYFLKNKLEYTKDKYIPLDYIVTKFEIMFPVVFDCNYGKDNLTPSTFFSIQGYSEQIFTIKQLLKKIFIELTENNCKDMENYNYNFSPIENRIQTYPLKDKKTKEYCIGFRFGAKDTENVVQYIYIPSKNLLRRRNPIKDQEKYWIISERFNQELQEIENIETNNNELSIGHIK